LDFSLVHCWDCPTQLSSIAITYAGLIAAAAAGAAMQRTAWRFVQLIGFLLTAFAVLLAAMMTMTAPRWGIWRSLNPLRTFSRATVWMIYASLDALLVAVIVLVLRLRTTRSSPSP
jgi:hypothetical protein